MTEGEKEGWFYAGCVLGYGSVIALLSLPVALSTGDIRTWYWCVAFGINIFTLITCIRTGNRWLVTRYIHQANPVKALKACIKVAQVCRKLGVVDEGMCNQISVLAAQIQRYGIVLIKRRPV
jgi:hypothetical protein